MRLWLLVNNFGAKAHMELNAPVDILSKRQDINSVLIMHLPKDLVLICIAAVCWLIMVNTNFAKKFLFEGNRM